MAEDNNNSSTVLHLGSSNNQLSPSLSLEDKLALSVELCEIALRCKGCSKLFKQAIQNHLKEGGPSIGSSRLTEEVYNNENIRS